MTGGIVDGGSFRTFTPGVAIGLSRYQIVKNKILNFYLLFISVKNIVYFHSMYGIMLISPDNPNYIQFCEA